MRKLDALFAAVYASPSDDGPRLVLADALQERGDPRGELISLQCQSTVTPERTKREAALLRKHGKAWLGELEPFIRRQGARDGRGKPVFRRGFLASATVSGAEDVPAWATLEELWFFGGSLVPSMRGVKIFRHPYQDELLGSAEPWGVEELHLHVRDLDVAERYAQSDRIPRLARLVLEGPADWVRGARWAKQLTHLQIMPQGKAGRGGDASRVPEFVVTAPQRFPALQTLSLQLTFLGESSHWLCRSVLSLSRDASGHFTIGRLHHSEGNYSAKTFSEGIESILSQISLRELSVTSSEPVEESLRAALVESARAHGATLDLTKVGGAVHRNEFSARVVPSTPTVLLGWVSQVAFAPDGASLFVGGSKGVVVVDPRTQTIRELFASEGRVQALAVCDQYIAASDYSNVRLYTPKGKRLWRKSFVPSSICGIAFSPDGERFAVGAENKMVVVVESKSGAPGAPMKHHESYVNDLAFSPDGKLLATVGLDDTVRIIDVAKRRLLKTLTGHKKPVTHVVFSADGARMMTTSYDATVRAWSVATGLELAQHARKGGDGFKGSQALCMTGDGVLVAWNDGDVTKHDPDTLAVTARVTTEKDLELEDIAVSPDGSIIAVTHDNGLFFIDAAKHAVSGDLRDRSEASAL